MKDGFVIKKPAVIHSRSRALRNAEAKSKGRHTGYGEQLLTTQHPPAFCTVRVPLAGTGLQQQQQAHAEAVCALSVGARRHSLLAVRARRRTHGRTPAAALELLEQQQQQQTWCTLTPLKLMEAATMAHSILASKSPTWGQFQPAGAGNGHCSYGTGEGPAATPPATFNLPLCSWAHPGGAQAAGSDGRSSVQHAGSRR